MAHLDEDSLPPPTTGKTPPCKASTKCLVWMRTVSEVVGRMHWIDSHRPAPPVNTVCSLSVATYWLNGVWHLWPEPGLQYTRDSVQVTCPHCIEVAADCVEDALLLRGSKPCSRPGEL